jgi:ABC-type transport system substrate-binding protein
MDGRIKNIVIFILSIALIVNLILPIFLSFGPENITPQPSNYSFVVGMNEGPTEIDPVNSWESESEDVIYQVCEGLYMYNLSDPKLGLVPRLAIDYGIWDVSGTHFTISLRQNVTFHDGTSLNAEAVKWNFERINWLINGTGKLNTTLSQVHYLWEFPNGTEILDSNNPVSINNEFNITINLRAPYAILESLLCHVSAFMLSPESSPKYEYIHPHYGRLVGTGPFVFDYYLSDTEVKFHRWENYWREPAFFKDLTFAVIKDATTRNNAMLGHNIDYLIGPIYSLYSTFDADQTITHQSGIGSLDYYYLAMNNNAINKTWRQAISCAINYTHVIELFNTSFYHKSAFRSNGPLAPNFPMYDPTIQAATYNLTKAREIVISMGFGDMAWTDAQWKATSFATWNYTYNYGNDFREDLGVLLVDYLDLVGIEIVEVGYSSYDIPPSLDSYELVWLFWNYQSMIPNFPSPFYIITSLFSNKSTKWIFRYHNHAVEMWLEDVLSETNATRRANLYSKILYQIVEVDMPHAFLFHSYQHFVHSADIDNVAYNAMDILYIYPMYRIKDW